MYMSTTTTLQNIIDKNANAYWKNAIGESKNILNEARDAANALTKTYQPRHIPAPVIEKAVIANTNTSNIPIDELSMKEITNNPAFDDMALQDAQLRRGDDKEVITDTFESRVTGGRRRKTKKKKIRKRKIKRGKNRTNKKKSLKRRRTRRRR